MNGKTERIAESRPSISWIQETIYKFGTFSIRQKQLWSVGSDLNLAFESQRSFLISRRSLVMARRLDGKAASRKVGQPEGKTACRGRQPELQVLKSSGAMIIQIGVEFACIIYACVWRPIVWWLRTFLLVIPAGNWIYNCNLSRVLVGHQWWQPHIIEFRLECCE